MSAYMLPNGMGVNELKDYLKNANLLQKQRGLTDSEMKDFKHVCWLVKDAFLTGKGSKKKKAYEMMCKYAGALDKKQTGRNRKQRAAYMQSKCWQ